MVALVASGVPRRFFSLRSSSRYFAGSFDQPAQLIALVGGDIVDAAAIKIGKRFHSRLVFEGSLSAIETLRLRGPRFIDADVTWSVLPIYCRNLQKIEVITPNRPGLVANLCDVLEAQNTMVSLVHGGKFRAQAGPEYFRLTAYAKLPLEVSLSDLRESLFNATDSYDTVVDFPAKENTDPIAQLSTGWTQI